MKIIMLITLSILIISCGKKSSSKGDNKVSTTPAISVDEEQELSDSNQHFSATANKSTYELDELILVEIQNLSSSPMSHNDLYFGADTEELIVSKINCFHQLNYNETCSFVLRFQNPKEGHHKIKVSYKELNLRLSITLNGGEAPEPIEFLYQNYHTYNDCYQSFKLGQNGFVKYQNGNNYCSFRGADWNKSEKTQIETDPLVAMIDPNINASEYFCPEGWTIDSFEFSEAVVVEHTNFWGGRKDVTIPAGESKEICVKRNLFGCKERKRYYSRLTKVNCY